MATKKERPASALTIVQNALDEKRPNYGHFRPSGSGNSPGSLPAGLPARLPYGLPEPAVPASAFSSRARDAFASPKAPSAVSRKHARLPDFNAPAPGRRRPRHGRAQPGAFLREPGALGRALEPDSSRLGMPLNIAEAARLIGCSPWSVRQTLIPRGLPHFRFTANGRLIFYRDQVIRWIENQQQGGKTTL
jgi:hypothetical protein